MDTGRVTLRIRDVPGVVYPDPWEPSEGPLSVYPSPYFEGGAGCAWLVGHTRFHHEQHYPGMMPGLPGTTTIVLYATNGLRTVHNFTHCFGTRTRLEHGFPEAIFLSDPVACPTCDSHVCTLRFAEYSITNFHTVLAKGSSLPNSEAPSWVDLLVVDRNFFFSNIRPFLTAYPVLRTFGNLGNTLPGSRVYMVSRSHRCKEMPLRFQHVCCIRTLQIRPLVLRYILAAHVMPINANGHRFRLDPRARVYRAPEEETYTFARNFHLGHSHYVILDHYPSDSMQFANYWAADMKQARRYMQGSPFLPVVHTAGTSEWSCYVTELHVNHYDYLCDIILDFLIGTEPRFRSRSSVVRARQVEFRRERAARRRLRTRP